MMHPNTTLASLAHQMALIPFGLLSGSPASVGSFLFDNLVPVTLGNLVGGKLCVAASYNYIHGTDDE